MNRSWCGLGKMKKKRIAIMTLRVGAGHVKASEAIQRALEDGGDQLEVRTMDVAEFCRPWFHWLYVQSYWLMLRHAPGMWRKLFERRQEKQHRATAPEWLFRRGCAPLYRELRNFAPHLVVATEIGAAEVAALAKRGGWITSPIQAVQTDFHTEPPWVQEEVDVFCVGSGEARTQLVQWGVLPGRIRICGIPVDPAFALPFDRDDLRRALGLDRQRPVVLVMGGGMGPVPLDRIVTDLQSCESPLQVLAVAGHDHAVKNKLDLMRGKVALDIHTFGWTDNVPELMAASDLLITKPGGVTIAESLAAGLPMILTHPIPGPEERHAQYLARHGVAVLADPEENIGPITNELLSCRDKLREMKRRAHELSRPDATHTIAQIGRAMLEREDSIELLPVPYTRSGDSAYLM